MTAVSSPTGKLINLSLIWSIRTNTFLAEKVTTILDSSNLLCIFWIFMTMKKVYIRMKNLCRTDQTMRTTRQTNRRSFRRAKSTMKSATLSWVMRIITWLQRTLVSDGMMRQSWWATFKIRIWRSLMCRRITWLDRLTIRIMSRLLFWMWVLRFRWITLVNLRLRCKPRLLSLTTNHQSQSPNLLQPVQLQTLTPTDKNPFYLNTLKHQT